MHELATILWLRRRLAIREISGLAGAVNLAAGVALLVVAAAGALALAAGLGFVLQLAVASGEDGAVSSAWSTILHTVAFFALGVPILVGAGETSFDPARLLRFPVSRRRLHHLSLASEFISKIHLAWYPVILTAAVIGILIPGPARLGQTAVIVLFTITMVGWSHAGLLTLRRVLKHRSLREIATVLALVVILPIALLPAAVDLRSDDLDRELEELFTIPGWVTSTASVFPPSITTRALEGWRTGRYGSGLAEILWLGLWCAAGIAAGGFAFDRLLDAESGGGGRPAAPRPGRSGAWGVLDRLDPAAGAVAAKELRYLFQSGVGRVSLLVMPVMTALPAALTGHGPATEVFGVSVEPMVFAGIMIYAAALTGYLQVNTFCWERSGLALYFTSPVRPRDVLFGKNLGVWLFNGLFAVEGLVVWSFIRGLPHPSVIASGILIFASTTVLMTLVGNFSSIAFPVDRPVAAVTSATSPVGTLVMLGCLLVGVVMAGVWITGTVLVDGPIVRMLPAVAVFGAVAGTYSLSLPRASAVLRDRRDEVFRALSG